MVSCLLEFFSSSVIRFFKKLNKLWRERLYSEQCVLAAFLCALAVFWCEIPRDPYMVKAKRECEAEGSVICYHSQRLKQESKAISRRVTSPKCERYVRYAGIPMQINKKSKAKTEIWTYRYKKEHSNKWQEGW